MKLSALQFAIFVAAGAGVMPFALPTQAAQPADIIAILAAADENGVPLDDGKRPHTRGQHRALVEKSKTAKHEAATSSEPSDGIPLGDRKRPHTKAQHEQARMAKAKEDPAAAETTDHVPLTDGKRPHTRGQHKARVEKAQQEKASEAK